MHLAASIVLAILAGLHAALTPFLYEQWAPRAVWFLGTGLGLLLLAVMNLSHLGLEPCRQPTVRALKAVNWLFVAFGVGAVIAVPEPQAFIVLLALVGQAIAALKTMPGPA